MLGKALLLVTPLTYPTGELATRASWPHGRVGHLRQAPTKTTTIHNSTALSRTVIENCNRLFYSESLAASCLHVRALCPASPQRPQRRWLGSPASMRILFVPFFLSLRALNSFKVVRRTPSLAVRVPSACIRFFLRALRREAASLAA